MKHLTGYQLAQIASEKLGRTIKPQMVYNYMKKGYIKTTPVKNAKGETVKVVTIEAAAQFIKNLQAEKTDRKAALASALEAVNELL